MGTIITTTRFCDVCAAESDETNTDASAFTLSVGQAPVTLDLCERHERELIEPVRLLIAAHGYRVQGPNARGKAPSSASAARAPRGGTTGPRGRPAPADGAMACLWCPVTYGAKSTSSMANHLRTVHGFASARAAFGEVPCPQCGGGPFNALGAHLTNTHDAAGAPISRALLRARDEGDRYGAYATVASRAPMLDGAP